MTEQTIVAAAGCAAVIVLMVMRVPIAVSLGAVAVVGFARLAGFEPAFGILIDSPIRTVTNFNFSVIPMFILMGSLVSASGMSRELYRFVNAWIGHLPGGIAIATVLACGGFAAVNGSSIASAAAMTKVALPEMRRAGYDPGFASGVIASGGTLAIMIPPSVLFVLYALITENDIASLFIAGVFPGLLALALYCGVVQVVYRMKPEWMPRSVRASREERLDSLRDIWPTFLLIGVVAGAIYGGFATILESAALGVLGAFVIGVARGRLPWPVIVASLVDALRTSAAIFFILIAVFLFQYFLAVTQTSQQLAQFLAGLPFSPMGVMIIILAFYLLAGMFVDGLAVVLLTIPIVYPVVLDIGFDAIWFGVVVVTAVEVGLISPPLGIICFTINNMVPDIRLVAIYRGVLPFIVADAVRLTLLLLFPGIALYLVRATG